MKLKLFIISVIIIASNTISYSQNSIYVNGTVGYFIYHYDNTLLITENKNLGLGLGINGGFIHSLNEDYNLIFETGYYYSTVKDASIYTMVGEFNSYSFHYDLTQYSFPFDITISKNISNYVNVGLGLSVEGINRTIKTILPSNLGIEYDKINLFALGANGLAQFRLPLDRSETISILGNIKIRYLYSIWEGSGNRNLSGYKFKFLQSIFSAGICYKF